MRRLAAALAFSALLVPFGDVAQAGDFCIFSACDPICVNAMNCVPAHGTVDPGGPPRQITFGLDGGQDSGLTVIICGGGTCTGQLIVLGMDHGKTGVSVDFLNLDARIYIPWLLTPLVPYRGDASSSAMA